MTRFIRSLLFGVALATSPLAFAESAAPPSGGDSGSHEKVREACHGDVARLCSDVEAGQGRIRDCLRAHQDELSEACRAAIREARAHHHPRSEQN